jgi:hypothetical protein
MPTGILNVIDNPFLCALVGNLRGSDLGFTNQKFTPDTSDSDGIKQTQTIKQN